MKKIITLCILIQCIINHSFALHVHEKNNQLYSSIDSIPVVSHLKKDTATSFTKIEIEAAYPGGEAAWVKYITNEMNARMDELSKIRKGGTCRVRFIIDKDGNVTDVKALNMEGSRLAKVAVDIVQNSRKWKPAQQDGRPVKAYREQPFTFTIEK